MLTLTEAAGLLGLSPTTLRIQIRNGKLKARKLGRDWIVSKAEVERYRRESLQPVKGHGMHERRWPGESG